MTASSPDDTPTVLVCRTSHPDWDWHDTFAEYFAVGPLGDDITPGFGCAVSVILGGVCDLLSTRPPRTGPKFSYSVAEVAYVQAFAAASPDRLPVLRSAGTDRAVGR